MALAYLLDPTNQYQNVAGVNNVSGWFEVFISDTPERADVYVDFAGTRAPERIGIDNDGRAVMVVDGDGVYRVEMHAPNGDLLWTQYPVWPVGQGGGGAIGVGIGSSDGSIDVQRTQVGSVVNYDLSVAGDGTDLLEWIRTEGYTSVSGNMVPTYQAGTMEVYPEGIRLYGNRYYHVTGRIRAVVHTLQPNYNEFSILVRGWDGEAYTTYLDMPAVIDGSMGSTQEWEFSTDIMPSADSDISVTVSGLDTVNNSVGVLDMEIHRVYSGAPNIPGRVASREWVEENYQEKLVPGPGIEIDENNVITATAGDTEIYTVEYGGQSIEEGTVFDEAYAAYLAGKTLVLKGSNFTGTLCHYSSAYGLLFSVMNANMSGSGSTAVTDGGVTYYWLYKYGTQSRWDNSGVKFLPRSYSADAGKVLMVDPQYPTATPIWASLPDLSAYVTDTELETILEGYVTTAALQTALLGKQDVIADLSDIRSGAALGATAVQDPDYVHTDNNFTSSEKAKLAGIATGAEVNVQSDWNETNTSSDAYIQNKPTIPTVDQTYSSSSTNAQSGTAVAEAIAGVDNTFIAVYGVTPIGEVDTAYSQGKDIICRYNDGHGHVYSSQLSSLVSGMYTFSTTEWFTDYEFRLSPNGGTGDWSISSRAIPSGTQLVPAATQSDAGEVLTVDQNGVPEWAPAQAPVSAGNGIDITNNVISIDTSVVATQTDLTNGLATKQDTISDLNTIRSGAQAGATAVQPGDLATVATTGAYSDLTGTPTIPTATSDLTNDSGFITLSDVPAQVNADWNSSSGASEILNKPTIPSGAQLVPAATSADADKVLTVDSQGTPAWASAQAPISAGNGIDITSNTVSAKVDGSTITFNASGEMVASGGGVVPPLKPVVAGSNITITENTNDVTIAAVVPVIGTITL